MDYFKKFSECEKYYSVYNRNLKCREFLEYYKDIVFSEFKFILNCKFHNIKGPAYILYYNNEIHRECFFINGVLHNKNGPVVIHYENNKVSCEEYYINDIKYSVLYYDNIKQ